MSSPPNGRQGDHGDPIRRLRYDDWLSTVVRISERGRGVSWEGGGASMPWLPRSHSGRRFVIVAGLAVLVIWGMLFLAFRDWRARYRERAAFGTSQVVPAIDPMVDLLPPGVEPAAWREAVGQTRDLLRTVVGSNLLDLDAMRALRGELDQTVARARAHPETAVAELAGVWDRVAHRGEFLFQDSRSASGDRHRRPRILPARFRP